MPIRKGIQYVEGAFVERRKMSNGQVMKKQWNEKKNGYVLDNRVQMIVLLDEKEGEGKGERERERGRGREKLKMWRAPKVTWMMKQHKGVGRDLIQWEEYETFTNIKVFLVKKEASQRKF